MKLMNNKNGFTVIELTIATAIFATVLLVGLTAFLGVGKVFYKSVSLTQTQAVAEQIVAQVSADIQFAPTVVTNYPAGTGLPAGNDLSQFVCLGNTRYTFNLFRKVDLGNHDEQQNFGILRDILPGSSGCNKPFGEGSTPLNKPTELLGNKMRLSQLNLSPAKDAGGGDVNNLWDVNVIVAYGDDEVLTEPGAESVSCDANLSSTQFCSVAKQNTTVSKGL